MCGKFPDQSRPVGERVSGCTDRAAGFTFVRLVSVSEQASSQSTQPEEVIKRVCLLRMVPSSSIIEN